MATPLNPQEIYLLERYTSLEYFGEVRDAWGAMIKHVEDCLDAFMRNLPRNYRNRPLPEQPDIVWGGRVLPNFRDTFQSLCNGYIRLSHGDVSGLNYAHGPSNDFRGQMDFWPGWMGEKDEETYRDLMGNATQKARNINFTESASWDPGNLTNRYNERGRGPLNPPARWPEYSRVPSVKVATGAPIPRSGIYIPDIDDSCAQFLSTNYDAAPEAGVFVRMVERYHPVTGEKRADEPVYEHRPCTWTLVERASNESPSVNTPSLFSQKSYRVPAGDSCPESGYYFTPAKADSRRRFEQGEPMPQVENVYGSTIWQWDINQGEGKP